MDFLEALIHPASPPSIQSSEQYSTAMVKGWVDGLRYLQPDFDAISSVKYMKPTPFFRRLHDAGDIDLLMSFTADVKLTDLLPESGYVIRPDIATTWQFNGFLCESKRSCGNQSVDKHIDQLIKFYKGLLEPSSSYRLKAGRALSSNLQAVIDNVNSPIVFLFNGADYNDVWNRFLRKVPSGRIQGRHVCMLYCQADQLTRWVDIQEERRKTMEEHTLRVEEQTLRLAEQSLRMVEQSLRMEKDRELEAARLEIERLKKQCGESI